MEEEVSSRAIVLQEINPKSAEMVIKTVTNLNQEDDANETILKDYERPPIKLIISSYGGSVYDGLAIIAAIRSSKTPIHTYTYGHAMSMGFIINLFGERRFADKYATFMFHDMSTGVHGTVKEIEIDLDENKKLRDMVVEILYERTKINKKVINNTINSRLDLYFTAEKAKELQIVDEVI